MPTYKFFEAKASGCEASKFEPFNLMTNERSQSRKRQSLPAAEQQASVLRKSQTQTFKARAMPDFSEKLNGV